MKKSFFKKRSAKFYLKFDGAEAFVEQGFLGNIKSLCLEIIPQVTRRIISVEDEVRSHPHHQLRNIKLVLEYDGSEFYGFQRQDPKPTIQKSIEEAFGHLLGKETKIKSASGRTDSGVHAEGQVVNFFTASNLPLSNIQRGLNRFLPKTIAVKSVEEVSQRFHSRFSAKSKTYEYRIWNDPVRSPLHADRTFHVAYPLDLKKMKAAGKVLIGRHDFRSFCSSDPHRAAKKQSFVRKVMRLEMAKEGSLLRLRIEADGFLYHMVRNLVGSLIEVGREKWSLDELKRVMLAKNRAKTGMTVPSHGLSLINVKY